MDYTTAYLVGFVVMNGLYAIRLPHEDCRMVFALSVFWPATIVAIALMFIVLATGWDFDVTEGRKMFGFRKPTNPKAKGYALTLFKLELQLYKVAK